MPISYREQGSLRLRRSGGGDRIILNWRKVGVPIILNGPFSSSSFCHNPMYLASLIASPVAGQCAGKDGQNKKSGQTPLKVRTALISCSSYAHLISCSSHLISSHFISSHLMLMSCPSHLKTGVRNWGEKPESETGVRNWGENLGSETGVRNWGEKLG